MGMDRVQSTQRVESFVDQNQEPHGVHHGTTKIRGMKSEGKDFDRLQQFTNQKE